MSVEVMWENQLDLKILSPPVGSQRAASAGGGPFHNQRIKQTYTLQADIFSKTAPRKRDKSFTINYWKSFLCNQSV